MRWTQISVGKRFVFNLRSSAFIGGQSCVCLFPQPGHHADRRKFSLSE
jgi:hypothetical protein